MRVSFMHNLHAETGTVQDVSPGVDNPVLGVHDGLIEVETIPRFLHSFLSEWGGLYLHP